MILLASTILRDWFDWSNAGVGLVGLALTLWAVWQAKGAKEAATRAERSVRRHNAAADFGSLARMAKELHGYVESGRMSEARLRTTDLRSDLALAIRLHSTFIGAQLSKITDMQFELTLVTDELNQRSVDLNHAEKVRLLRITGAILDVLAGQSGELRSDVETGVPNE